jgi:lysophospholipase L1-like esterase
MKNILCFGDSLTAGYYNEGEKFHPYSLKLEELLNDVCVDHIGLSGWTTEEMLDNIDNPECEDCVGRKWPGLRVQLRKKSYEYCIVLAGTNDLFDLCAKDIAINLLELYRLVHKEGCKTIALTIPDMRIESVMPEITNNKQIINKWLKTLSEITVVDIASCLSDSNPWDNDGLHFTPYGYDTIGTIIKNMGIL